MGLLGTGGKIGRIAVRRVTSNNPRRICGVPVPLLVCKVANKLNIDNSEIELTGTQAIRPWFASLNLSSFLRLNKRLIMLVSEV